MVCGKGLVVALSIWKLHMSPLDSYACLSEL